LVDHHLSLMLMAPFLHLLESQLVSHDAFAFLLELFVGLSQLLLTILFFFLLKILPGNLSPLGLHVECSLVVYNIVLDLSLCQLVKATLFL
jgi:hypothetical protein